MNHHSLRLARPAGPVRDYDLDGDECAAPGTRLLAFYELHAHAEEVSTLSNRYHAVETASFCSEPKAWRGGLSGERRVIAEYRRAARANPAESE
jgi:hypothetical protein